MRRLSGEAKKIMKIYGLYPGEFAIVLIVLLLSLFLAGCRQTCPAVAPEQSTWVDASGQVWVGGCVEMKAE